MPCRGKVREERSASAFRVFSAAKEGNHVLVYRNEPPLFAIALILSLLAWLLLLVGTLGIALVYAGFAFIAYLFIQSAVISYLRGNATQISAEQFPAGGGRDPGVPGLQGPRAGE